MQWHSEAFSFSTPVYVEWKGIFQQHAAGDMQWSVTAQSNKSYKRHDAPPNGGIRPVSVALRCAVELFATQVAV